MVNSKSSLTTINCWERLMYRFRFTLVKIANSYCGDDGGSALNPLSFSDYC
jgi:hypothetical protein